MAFPGGMKQSRPMPAAVLAALLAGLAWPAADAGELRTWTSTSGASITAAFVAVKSGNVILEQAGGERIQIRRQALRSADRAYIDSLNKPDGTTSATRIDPRAQWPDP